LPNDKDLLQFTTSIDHSPFTKKNFEMIITWDDFEKIDIRTGTIIAVADFPKAKRPAYQLTIDFGESGIKKSSAQIVSLYSKEDLLGKQIVAIVNFPPKQIADFMSECLVLGVYTEKNEVVLLQPQRTVQNGLKIG
jgi:tRNA-binding protein